MKKRPTPTIFSSITGENLRNQSIWGIWLYFNVLKALRKYKNSLTMTSLKFLTLTIPNIEILLMNGSLGPWLRSSWQKVHKNSNNKNFSGCWDSFIEVNSQLKDKNMKSIWMWKSTLKICFVLKFSRFIFDWLSFGNPDFILNLSFDIPSIINFLKILKMNPLNVKFFIV